MDTPLSPSQLPPRVTGRYATIDRFLPVAVGRPCVWPSIRVVSRDELVAYLGTMSPREIGIPKERFICLDPRISKSARTRGESYPTQFWPHFCRLWETALVNPTSRKSTLHELYRSLGPVTAAGVHHNYESLEAVCRATKWFRALTTVASLVTRQDFPGLLRVLLEPSSNSRSGCCFSAVIPGVAGTEELTLSLGMPGDVGHDSALRQLLQQDSASLLRRAELGVVAAVTARLAQIALWPVEHKSRFYWGFHPVGALDAAFLDWFFQWSQADSKVCCEACGKPLRGKRRRWCSDPCRERMYKREQRRKKGFAMRTGTA
jgi:hypothetical protein